MHRVLAAVALLTAFFSSCSPRYTRYVSQYNVADAKPEPDYSNLNYWAAHPYKKDLSDSVPQPLRSSYTLDSVVDVFFIHPTTFTSAKDLRMNPSLNEAALNAKTDHSSILFQASVFNEQRVFAPRYRQAHLRAYFIKDTVAALAAFDSAYADVKAAFQYYLSHWNGGRPMIIASHSQGSTHAIRLLKEFFDGTVLGNRLIVAYIPGMNIPLNSFVALQPCQDSVQTGCFCGWRTYRHGHEPVMESRYRQSFVTNPINWRTDETYAGADQHKGAILRNFNKVYRQITDAQVHDGILWVKRPQFPGSFLYRTANYHIGDINLFYLNIRSNIQTRIRAFWKR